MRLRARRRRGARGPIKPAVRPGGSHRGRALETRRSCAALRGRRAPARGPVEASRARGQALDARGRALGGEGERALVVRAPRLGLHVGGDLRFSERGPLRVVAALRAARGRDGARSAGRSAAGAPGGLRLAAGALAHAGARGLVHARVHADAADDVVIAHDVRVDVVVEHVSRRAEHVRGGERRPEPHGHAARPVIERRSRRPADIAIVARAPDNPRRRVDAAGDPSPTSPRDPNPATVVEGDITPLVIAHPKPIAVGRELPAARGLVRGEVGAHDDRARDPHSAVRRVLDPSAIGRKGLAEIGERAWVGVDVVIGFDGGLDRSVDIDRLRLRGVARGRGGSARGRQVGKRVRRVALREAVFALRQGGRRGRERRKNKGHGARGAPEESPGPRSGRGNDIERARRFTSEHRVHDGAFLLWAPKTLSARRELNGELNGELDGRVCPGFLGP